MKNSGKKKKSGLSEAKKKIVTNPGVHEVCIPVEGERQQDF